MKITSKQIQQLWEEKTGSKLRTDFAETIVTYIGCDRNRLALIETMIERAAKLSFETEGERFLHLGYMLHDLHTSGPLPAQILKEPAARSFADQHDKRLRSATEILGEFMERPWHRGMKNAMVNFIEQVNAAPDDYWSHAVRFWETAFPVNENVELFIRDRGLHSTHGDLSKYVAASLNFADVPSDSASA